MICVLRLRVVHSHIPRDSDDLVRPALVIGLLAQQLHLLLAHRLHFRSTPSSELVLHCETVSIPVSFQLLVEYHGLFVRVQTVLRLRKLRSKQVRLLRPLEPLLVEIL